MNVPDRIREFQQRVQEAIQREVDALYDETGLVVKHVDIPCEVLDVSSFSPTGPVHQYRVSVERVNARIDI